MKRSMPWNHQVDVILLDESSSSSDLDDAGSGSKQSNNNVSIDQPVEKEDSEGLMIKKAQMYQDYMKQIPVPTQRSSVIPFTCWTGLAKSIKLLYGQPLHYLTNILLKQWDKIRIAGDNDDGPLDVAIHPCKAEASIWLIEEVHRLTTSPHHLAKLWLSDPMAHVYIDPIFPEL